MDSKGQVGLDTAKAVMLALLIIASIGFLIIILLGSLNTTTVASESGFIEVVNETGGRLNDSGYTLAGASNPGFNAVSIISVRNGSVLVRAGNYTVSGAGVVTNTSGVGYFDVAIRYSYRYNSFESIHRNVSDGTQNFFNNTGTWFALLAVVIIILIIAIVIFAVNRFGGSSGARL